MLSWRLSQFIEPPSYHNDFCIVVAIKTRVDTLFPAAINGQKHLLKFEVTCWCFDQTLKGPKVG